MYRRMRDEHAAHIRWRVRLPHPRVRRRLSPAASATFTPPRAPASAYRDVQRALGLSRVIVVQPTGYGFDNRCTLSAIAQLGEGARGIAVVPPDVSDDELQRLHDAGVRGVRFMMLPGGVMPWDAMADMSARIAPLGWNINLQLDGHTLPQHEAMLARLPSKLVIDHLGKFRACYGAERWLCFVVPSARWAALLGQTVRAV